MQPHSHLIFIYNDFRIGNKNNLHFFNFRFLGVGKTVKEYTMIGIRKTREVFVTEDEIEKAYPKSQIVGELYEISTNLLTALDYFIILSNNWKRKKVDIIVKDKKYTAFMYFHNETPFQNNEIMRDIPIRLGGKRFFPVPSGDWTTFSLLHNFKQPLS